MVPLGEGSPLGLLSWCDRLIPADVRAAQRSERMRQRLLVAVGLFLAALVIPWYLGLFIVDPVIRPARVATLFLVLLLLPAPVWLRWLGTRGTARLFLGVAHLAVFANLVLLSAFSGPTIAAVICLPVMTAVLVGARAAWIDAIVVLVVAIGIDLWLETQGIGPFAPEHLFAQIELMTVGISMTLSVMFVAAYSDMVRAQEARLRWLAHHDQLTHLANRHQVSAFIDQQVSRAGSHAPIVGPDGCAVLLLDLDFFKAINDEWDYAVGDRVLVAVAEKLRAFDDDHTLVARWGGEEFLIVALARQEADLCHLLDNVFRALGKVSVAVRANAKVRVTASIGYVFCRGELQRIEEWERCIAIANAGMKQAKRSGRNRAVGYRSLQKSLDTREGRLDIAALEGRGALHRYAEWQPDNGQASEPAMQKEA